MGVFHRLPNVAVTGELSRLRYACSALDESGDVGVPASCMEFSYAVIRLVGNPIPFEMLFYRIARCGAW